MVVRSAPRLPVLDRTRRPRDHRHICTYTASLGSGIWLGLRGYGMQERVERFNARSDGGVMNDEEESTWPKPPRGFPSWGYYLLRFMLRWMFCYYALLAVSFSSAVYAFQRGAPMDGSLWVAAFVVLLLWPYGYRRYRGSRRARVSQAPGVHYGDPVITRSQTDVRATKASADQTRGGHRILR